jgi:hypothetical protein
LPKLRTRQDQAFWQIVKDLEWRLEDSGGDPPKPPDEPEFDRGARASRQQTTSGGDGEAELVELGHHQRGLTGRGAQLPHARRVGRDHFRDEWVRLAGHTVQRPHSQATAEPRHLLRVDAGREHQPVPDHRQPAHHTAPYPGQPRCLMTS